MTTLKAAAAARFATAAFGAALGFMLAVASPSVAQEGEPMFPLLVQRASEIAEIQLDARRYSIDLTYREDGTVVDASRGDYPMKAGVGERVMSELASFLKVSVATTDPLRYGFYDVEGPSPHEEDVHVRVIARNGDVLVDAVIGAAIVIPDTNRSATAVRNTDEAEVWYTTGGYLTVPAQLSAWYDPVLQLPGRDIARISLSEGGTLLVDAMKEDFTTGHYTLTFVDPIILPPNTPAENVPADDNAFRSLAQAVVGVVFESAVGRDALAVPPGARVIRFESTAGYAVDVTLVPDGEVTWVMFDATALEGAPAEGVAAAAAIAARTANWAFRIPEIALTSLLRSPVELYIPPPIDFAAPPM